MKRRTKMVCTLGPAVNSKEQIAELIEAGMNVARLNCSHGDWGTRKQWVEWIRELSPDISPVGILVDLQGPKFRIGEISGGSTTLHTGETVTVGDDPNATIPVHQKEMLGALEKGSRVLLGDGLVELKLVAEQGSLFQAKVLSTGLVKSRQGFTLVNKVFDTPAMTDKDREDVAEACKLDIDYIALSYVNGAEDMAELKQLVDRLDPDIKLCAKIETREAIKNLDEILKVADLAMVARGDLGLQIDIEEVPIMQKRIIAKCNAAGRPVITATQMLESMLSSPRPTRAEAGDIANAILDGTDAVMLSGETASGQYPILAAQTMAKIAVEAESIFDHDAWRTQLCSRMRSESPTEAIAQSVAQLASVTHPRAILTTTTSGQTARLVSKYRPKPPILCATWDHKTFRQMSVVWGVNAIHIGMPSMTDEIISKAIEGFKAHKRLRPGDSVIVTAGVPAGVPGHTNLILNETVA
jgi:pyruvate kinase